MTPLANISGTPAIQSPGSNQDITSLIGNVIEHTPIDTNTPFVWPPAPAWWIIAVLFVVSFIAGAYLLKKHLNKKAHYRYLTSALDAVVPPPINAQPHLKWASISELNRAMKAIAVEQYGSAKVARLTGKQWLEFLDNTGRCDHFTLGAGQALGNQLYQAQDFSQSTNAPNFNDIKAACLHWCKEIC